MDATPDTPDAPAKEGRAKPVLRGPFGGRAIYIGRVFGIDIGIDTSWFFIFFLITFSMTQQFRTQHENWATGLVYMAAITTSLMFFVSLLLHELGHSVTSNALGLPIHSITLFLFGGVARLTREPDRPRDEFLIAVAGPLVSVMLGFGFLGLWAFIPEGTVALEVLREICFSLGSVNLVLVVFNCVPGFPLDGGRVLRSAIWAATNNYQKATRIAAAGGSAFAIFLIVMGLWTVVFGGGGFNGLWFALIGWFLLRASRASVTQMMFKDALSHARVAEAIEQNCVKVSGAISVAHLVEGPILRGGQRTFFVETHGKFIGVVNMETIKQLPREEWEVTPLQAVAVPPRPATSVSAEDGLWDAVQKMDQARLEMMPVLEEGRLVGVLNRMTVMQILRNRMELRRS